MATTQWGKILTLAAIQNKSRWRSLVGSTFFSRARFFAGSFFSKPLHPRRLQQPRAFFVRRTTSTPTLSNLKFVNWKLFLPVTLGLFGPVQCTGKASLFLVHFNRCCAFKLVW